MFLEFAPGHPNGERERMRLVDAGETGGVDAAWLSEFHFAAQRSVLSSYSLPLTRSSV